ncbi:hypothetical protein O0880_00755 [Janthinobacterium sp. SUN118]|uniref:hypothetical protein n=1 Tax=Janthinobacterium sp. SUN118 TaxID=3004100 RepID=UPI0025B18783|nr:hypothetical protein [Janthinobacterium sp. SUN118]MDN2707942.1 hypothetical protein [Janthinobacterium sp. SUN118]
MQLHKVFFSVFLFFFASNFCHATEFSAPIEKILIYGDGALVYVFPVGGVPGAPACHGKNGDYLSFSLTRPHAKEYYAGLLVAFASGKSVLFRGRNTCTDQSYSETLDYFMILKN